MLTRERLQELLHYDPETGVFTWAAPRTKVRRGDTAGGVTERGYLKIRVEGKKYRAHRLAWLYATGAWPLHEIDHKDGDKLNNRWANLREVTRRENMRNQRKFVTNTSGRTGVCRRGRLWTAYIGRGDSTQIQLGEFDSFDAAVAARVAAEQKLWGHGHLQQGH